MLYLGLAIIASALVSMVMRLSEGKIKNNMGMFVVNYAVCSFLSLLFMERPGFGKAEAGAGVAVGLGLFSGIVFDQFCPFAAEYQEKWRSLSCHIYEAGGVDSDTYGYHYFSRAARVSSGIRHRTGDCCYYHNSI